MAYKEYKQKLEKVVRFFDGVWRFKYLILCVLIAIVSLFIAFCSLSGNIYGEYCPSSVEYGTPVSFSAKAIFSDVSAEYRVKGESEWSSEEPKLTGEYEVRAVSHSWVGEKYGDVFSYTIVPRATGIVFPDRFIYGDSPEITVPLSYSDVVADVQFEYEEIAEDTFLITASVLSVVDGEGEDVSACYLIESAQAELACAPRPVTIATGSASKMYDGEPLSSESYAVSEGTLLEGHTLQLVSCTSAVNAGEYDNVLTFAVYDARRQDVSAHYALTCDCGTLTVSPRPIVVWTASGTWIYDGEGHNAAGVGDYGVSENSKYDLLAGQTLVPTETSVAANTIVNVTDSETEVKYLDNALQFSVLGEDDEDLTGNYSFSYEYGKLRIKTEIIVSLYSISKYYDGTPLSFQADDYSVVKPPDVEVVCVLPSVSLTNVGKLWASECDFSTGYVIAYDAANGQDVTSENRYRFDISDDYPLLEIKARQIEIASVSVVIEQTVDTFYGGDLANNAWISLGSLAEGETIVIVVSGVLTQEDDDPVENTIASVTVYNAAGQDVTYNYDISLKPGTLWWLT